MRSFLTLGLFVVMCTCAWVNSSAQDASDPGEARTHFDLGRTALESGDINQAVEHLEKAVALDDASSEYHLTLGLAYSRKLQTLPFMERGTIAVKMREEFETAIERDPKNIDARSALAQFYLQAPPIAGGSKEMAMEQLEAIRELDPVEGHLFAAQIYTRDEDFPAAEVEYEAALKISPDNADLHYRMGFFHQIQKEYDTASADFEKTLELDSEFMEAAYQIGRTAVFSGENLERGVEALSLYLEVETETGQPTWAHAHWRMGDLYVKMGKIELARKEYESALELDPDLEDARTALESLPKN